MSQLSTALFMSLAIGIAGCALDSGNDEFNQEDGVIDLTGVDSDGKADSVFGKRLYYTVIADEQWWRSQPIPASGFRDAENQEPIVVYPEVLAPDPSSFQVRSTRVSINVYPDENIDLLVQPPGDLELKEDKNELSFLLFTRSDSQEWSLASCAREGDESNRVYYFQAATLYSRDGDMYVTARKSYGTYSDLYFYFSECGVADKITAVAVLPFPSRVAYPGHYSTHIRASCKSGFRSCSE